MRPERQHACAGRAGQSGLVLIALLLMLMLVGVGALAAAEVWATSAKRERESELLWVGEQYRKAIESYWRTTPGPRKILPSSVEQLLNDERFPNPVHHLRAAYRDPMAPDTDLEPILVNNALIGVHSVSKAAPMKHAHFPPRYQQFALAEDYSQWQFIFQLPTAGRNPGLMPAPAPTPMPNPGALSGMPGRQ